VAVRLTQPQAIALAHWVPDVPALRPVYLYGPTLGTVRSLIVARMLWPVADAAIPEEGRLNLTVAGCAVLAHLIANEASCYINVRGRWAMSRCVGITQSEVREALAWAPEAA
jgi:hypothetical protein